MTQFATALTPQQAPPGWAWNGTAWVQSAPAAPPPPPPGAQPSWTPPAGGNGGMFGGIFNGVENVKVRTRAEYVREGHYLFKVDKTKVDYNRQRQMNVIIEMTCVAVHNNKQGLGHNIGDSVTRCIPNHGPGADYFLEDVKKFVGGMTGKDPNTITQPDIETVLGPGQPFSGHTAEVVGQTITTKKNTPYTVITFRREVPAAELLQTLTPQSIQQFYPNGVLNRMAEFDAQRGGPAAMPPPAVAPAMAPLPAPPPPAPAAPASGTPYLKIENGHGWNGTAWILLPR